MRIIHIHTVYMEFDFTGNICKSSIYEGEYVHMKIIDILALEARHPTEPKLN